MASCDVFLPICTLNVRRKSEPDFSAATRAFAEFAFEEPSLPSELDNFLEAIKPGWSTVFGSAFSTADIKFEDLRSLDSLRRGRLETELQKAGAKLLHIKKIRNALDALVDSADNHDARSDNQYMEPHNIYQSPMAAYFDECNAFNLLLATKCISLVPEMNGKICFSAMASDRNAENQCNRITNEVCSDMPTSPGKVHRDSDLQVVSGGISVDGLPFKSPMSAYFDGHESFGFGSTPTCTDTLSPLSGQTFSGISSDGGPARTNSNELIMDVGMPQILHSLPPQQNQILSSTTPHGIDDTLGKAKSIRWADEVGERKTLQLAELIGIESNETCAPMKGSSVWELSRDAKGCREVQKALSECESTEEHLAIAEQLRGHVLEAVHCPHANHVLHKIIGTLPTLCCNFIIQEVMQGGLIGVKEVAIHRYGCRIMEELLRVCHFSQLNEMIDCLLFEAEALCTHMYGNFVMKSVLRCASPIHRQRLLQVLMDNLVSMGTNFYACAVLAEVLQGNRIEGQTFAHMILSVSGLLSAIAKHKHGRRVLESMMTLLEDDQRRVLVKELTLPPIKVARIVKSPKK